MRIFRPGGVGQADVVDDERRNQRNAERGIAFSWTPEAAAALGVLGYSGQEVQIALKGVDVENMPLEEIIRQSLKKMVK